MIELDYVPCTCHDQEHRVVFEAEVLVDALLSQMEEEELKQLKEGLGAELFRRWALQPQHRCLVCGRTKPQNELLPHDNGWICQDVKRCLAGINYEEGLESAVRVD